MNKKKSTMLQLISWTEYLTFIVLASLIYYVVVFFIYYRGILVKPGGQKSLFTSLADIPASFQNGADEKENSEFLPQIHELVQSLKSFIGKVAERSFIKEEVVMGLQIILRDHKNIIGSSSQKAINDLIEVECEQRCSIQFSAEELMMLWLG